MKRIERGQAMPRTIGSSAEMWFAATTADPATGTRSLP
jgi:hypothetical protein